MSYMGGIRRGGGGSLIGRPPCHYVREGVLVNNLICNLVVNLFGGINIDPYLCIDNERSSRAGSLGGAWSVDSHLPYKKNKDH
jgi:hypothetical protein